MNTALPPLFLERLTEILPEDICASVLDGFQNIRPLTLRINTLKIQPEAVLDTLRERGIPFQAVSWYGDALIVPRSAEDELKKTGYFDNGHLYRQALSSMLPVIALDPRPDERILDMCAAPGSKMTQIAARMRGSGSIVALERVRGRYYKLRAVASLLGVKNAECKLMDARRYRPRELFDRVLVDVPCSSEGRFRADDPKTYAYWSVRKIREMTRKQRGLLLTASRFVKPGGAIIYATCTFAPEENEGVIDWILKKSDDISVAPVEIPGVERYQAIREWQGRQYHADVRHCFRVLPGEIMEGFFIAKLIRK